MSLVVGTAGHIDHGKTSLLRALTGIDADRLPEERRRGMTIDVGYAHLALPGGAVLDLVDVPGHDRLVGNMLVGAGEIDAALLVVAADDGPRPQTLEHLALLDALGLARGLAVVTKTDLVPPARIAAVVAETAGLLAGTTLAGVPVVAASAVTGEGLDAVRAALADLAAAEPRPADHAVLPGGVPGPGSGGGARLAVDRAFAVRGRGTVVTGTLRGGAVRAGDRLALLPDGGEVRVREVQVRGAVVDGAAGGRTALLVAGEGACRRGQVLAADPAVVATSRILVALRPPAALAPGAVPSLPADRARLRVHLGTDQADALVVRGPREALGLPGGLGVAILRLARPMAVAPGDHLALRRPSPGAAAGGGVVLDPDPPRGVGRRRLTAARAAALLAPSPGAAAARLDLHGALVAGTAVGLAPDVRDALADAALAAVEAAHAAAPDGSGPAATEVRRTLALAARWLATLTREAADRVARTVEADLVAGGRLARDGERLRSPARPAGLPPEILAAMDRLEAALAVPAPPALATAATAAGCPPAGVRALEAAGRIVRLEDDLAWAAPTWRALATRAVTLAAAGPLTPAAFRDATGTSRRYVLVLLEDLGRRGVLSRTDAGHVLGPAARVRPRAEA